MRWNTSLSHSTAACRWSAHAGSGLVRSPRQGLYLVLLLLWVGNASNAFSAPAAAPFDGKRAFELLRAQCRFGPRNPGSEGHTRCRDWITSACRQLDLATSHQPFIAYLPIIKKTMRLTNIVAIHQPNNPRKIMLSAHWDTRPVADWEGTEARRRQPILGANDGASGVAVLLELARVFQQTPPRVGVIFAFFDGEDSGERANAGFCLGSQFMAANLAPDFRIEKGINFDMVGDRDLSLPMEGYSWERARHVTLAFWEFAGAMYPKTFRLERGTPIYDDHVAFLERGIPYINVIDFDYPYWHTLEDTEDKCSAQSLEKVGRAAASFVLSQ